MALGILRKRIYVKLSCRREGDGTDMGHLVWLYTTLYRRSHDLQRKHSASCGFFTSLIKFKGCRNGGGGDIFPLILLGYNC